MFERIKFGAVLVYSLLKTLWMTRTLRDELKVFASNTSRCEDCEGPHLCQLHQKWFDHLMEHGEHPAFLEMPECPHCGGYIAHVTVTGPTTAYPSCCGTPTHPDLLNHERDED